MDVIEIMEVVKRGEDSKTQFKLIVDNADALAAEITAFANSEGGKLFIGIDDHCTIIGVSLQEVGQLNQMISNVCSQKINPPINVTTENILFGDKIILVVTVPLGINKFYMANGRDVWVKVGSAKRKASREELCRLMQESGNMYADEMPVSNTSITDIDLVEFERFVTKRMGMTVEKIGLSSDKLLERFKIIFGGKCTVAGILLFGKYPENAMPASVIKAVSFKGNDSGTTEYRDSRIITGNFSRVFSAGIAFLSISSINIKGMQALTGKESWKYRGKRSKKHLSMH